MIIVNDWKPLTIITKHSILDAAAALDPPLGAIHGTEIERPFLAAKGFNTNLVQFLPKHHVIISNVDVCSFMCTISYVHGRASKTVSGARNLVHEKL